MIRLLALLLLSSVAAHATQYDIPSARTATWTPGVTVGVPGGIPTTRTNIINVTQAPYNADNTGATNTVSAINAAIAAAAANDIVYLPAGTYRCDSQITIPYSKNNMTLRGAGTASTIIDARGGKGISFGLGVTWGSVFNPNSTIVGGLTAGSTTLTVADGSGFIANRGSRILIPDDPAIPVVTPYGYTNLVSFSVQVVGVSGNTLTVAPAIPATFGVTTGATIRQSQLATSYGIGIEDLTVNGANSGGGMFSGVQCEGTVYASWITNVKVLNHGNYGIYLADSMMMEVRRCYVDVAFGGGTNHAGYLINTLTGSLFEDNIVTDNFPGWEVNTATVGSVFAFNFVANAGKGFDTNHGPFNCFNLYEGNVSPNIQCDGYFGGAANDTFFRNWLSGVDAGSATYVASLNRFTRNYNLVGNIMQSPGFVYSGDGVSMGNPNLGNGDHVGTAEPSTGDYWVDYNSGTGKSKVWTGVLTTRTTDIAGTITLDTGMAAGFSAHLTGTGAVPGGAGIGYGSAGALINFAYFNQPSGSTTTFGTASGTLPAQGTAVSIYPSPAGYQELDLDVANTTLRKGNYYYFSSSIPAGESLAGQTLANSLFRSSKPADWGSLTWPAFNSAAPGTPAITQIPAGYFYTYGSWPNTTPGAPTITLNPVTQTATSGANVTFTASATGSPTPTWQWYKNAAPISGQTNSLLFLASVTSSNNGSYYAVATNSEGTATTTTATLTVGSVGTAPAITLNPTSRSVVAGANTTFTATASGNPTPTWQWYFNGALMPGKVTASLTITGAVAGNSGAYYARATNTVGVAQTSSATLTVTTSPETPLKAPTITSVK